MLVVCDFLIGIKNMENELKEIIENTKNLANKAGGDKEHFAILEKDNFEKVIKEAYEKGLYEGRSESPMFAVIPVSILENKSLSANAKLLYAEILALSKKSGLCYATNTYLGEILALSPRTIPDLLQELKGNGLVIVDIERSEEGTYRNIRVSYFTEGGYRSKASRGIAKSRGQKRNRQREIDKELHSRRNTSEYGKPEITKILNTLKEKFSLTRLDGSEKENRRYANLAIKKFGDDLPAIIEAAAKDEFWKNKVSNVKDIYYNGVKILQLKKGRIKAIDLSGMM